MRVATHPRFTHPRFARLGSWRSAITRLTIASLMAAVLLTATTMLGSGISQTQAQEQAQDAPSVLSTTQQTRWPTAVDFSAVVEGADLLEEAIFFYRVLPEGAITRQVAELDVGDVSRLSASVPTGNATTYIPAGADIEWFWQLTATDGEVIETERELFRYEDPRYDWRALRGENLILHYYDGNEAAAELLFREGEEAIAEMSELLEITLDFPARVYMWANSGDASGVEFTESESFEQLIITGGTRVLADLVHIFEPTVWVVRHELTHILTKVAGEGGIGNIPSWLDEGTATDAESDWRARRGEALNFAIESDQLYNVRSMVSVSNVPGRVDIFYGQAADLVTYLINTFGEDQFAEFFAVFKRGSTVDNALLDIYGFDRDGLDDAYRELLGLPALERAEDRSTTIEDEAIAPIGSPVDTADAVPEAAAGDAAEDATPTADAASADPEDEIVPRSDEEIAARVAVLERRLATRRPGPVFTNGSDFPWDELVTGVGAGALVLGLVLFLLLLRPTSPTSAGSSVALTESSSTRDARFDDQTAASTDVPVAPSPSAYSTTDPGPRPPSRGRSPGTLSPKSEADSSEWSGWGPRDDD